VTEPDVTTRMPDEIRPRALMVSYQAGSLEAFDQLYALVAPAIRGFLRRRLADADAVRDLEQETFLQLHRARHTFDPGYPALPWVMAIARHVWLMHERTRRRRPQPTVDVQTIEPGVRADAETYADRADVRAALATLSVERRRPVIWHHVIGLSFREIATRLGIREDAAKLRSSRGMGELREQFGVKPRGRKTAGHE
jgi:RNA polymerase sigma-70 factor (ECF subfamily)